MSELIHGQFDPLAPNKLSWGALEKPFEHLIRVDCVHIKLPRNVSDP